MAGRKFLTFSFDDGTVQDVRLVALLNQYGLKGTFNLNSGLFGTKHRIVHEGIECDHSEITADMVAELYTGHEIAVHTVTHPNLLDLEEDDIIREVKDDQRALEQLWGCPIIGMAFPGSSCHEERVICTIRKHTTIRYARNIDSHHGFFLPECPMQWQPTCHQNDPELFELAEQFLQAAGEEDMLFYLWGHSFEFDKFKSWDVFERFCARVAGRDGITYSTNGDVIRYMERANLL